MIMDCKALVEGCRRHDRLSQKSLYDAFAPMMLGVCIRYMGNREEAQDVLQDAFVKVFEKIHTLREPQALEDWVYHIVVRTALNALRKKRVQYEDIEEQPDMQAISYDPYSVEHIATAIANLPEMHRTVFNLREVEGYEFAEISKQLNVPETTLRSFLFRARKRLQASLRDIR